jgi:hypothetical protein
MSKLRALAILAGLSTLALTLGLGLPASADHSSPGPPWFQGRDVAVDVEFTQTNPARGFVLENNGIVHPFGGEASVLLPPSIGSQRAVALEIYDSGNSASGYVLTGDGKLHRWSTGSVADPPEIAVYSDFGFDIARDFEITVFGSGLAAGYVLTGYGSLHRFAGQGTQLPEALDDGPWWPNWDIARDLEIFEQTNGSVNGFILSGWGSLHPWSSTGADSPAQPTDTPYFPEWDIARAFTLFPFCSDPCGSVLDGWGGVHPYGGANPWDLENSPYWFGWDIARDIEGAGNFSCQAAFILDGWGARQPGHHEGCVV